MSTDLFERPITDIMTRDVVSGGPVVPVARLADLMIHHHVSCIPIVDERGRPRGMVTKSDLIELMDAEHGIDDNELATKTANDIMMPLAITLDEHATVAHAASMMAIEGFHHVMIVSETGTLVGLVSSYDIVRYLSETTQREREA